MCTTIRRILASASTNRGSEKGGLILLWGQYGVHLRVERQRRDPALLTPPVLIA